MLDTANQNVDEATQGGPAYGCLPLGVKAQRVYDWDEAPRFSSFSPVERRKTLDYEHIFCYTLAMRTIQTAYVGATVARPRAFSPRARIE
jgi:hypothetical protein